MLVLMMMGQDLVISVLGNIHSSFYSINIYLSGHILEEENKSCWVIKTYKII